MSDIIIIGAGIGGLCTAVQLEAEGKDFLLLEATDRVGGLVKTDVVDGFLLDRGFQVLQTAYPEAQEMLDYDALHLKKFKSGAVIQYKNDFTEIADPFRDPSALLQSLFSPIATPSDKIKMLTLKQRLKSKTVDEILNEKETTSLKFLKDYGFSNRIIESFFTPFLGGIFLERKLKTSSRMFCFVFKMFSEGDAALPANGIEAIPRQLASKIDPSKIKLNSTVKSITKNKVTLENGEEFTAENIVIACDPSSFMKDVPKTKYQSVTNLYFTAEEAALKKPYLILNGNGGGLINNLVFLNQIQPTYAPEGKNLISVSVIGNPNLSDQQIIDGVTEEMQDWFGPVANLWKFLKMYRIKNSLPENYALNANRSQSENGIHTIGASTSFGSLNAVMHQARMLSSKFVSGTEA